MQVSHFFNNTEGLNLTDSPFFVKDGQATGGYNFDYIKTGGVKKVNGPSLINAAADAQLKSLGLGIHNTVEGVKTAIRAAGTKIQTLNTDTGATTNVVEDTLAVNSDFLTAASNQTVVNIVFNSATNNLLWLAGGGMTIPYAYNGTTATRNGVDAPTGTFTAVNQGSATGGTGWVNGVYYYALVLRKTSTQALSNAALDQTITIASATDSVLLTFPTGVDTTKYDRWYIYRSSVGGSTAFTAGSLVAQVATTTPSYTDTNVTLATSQNVPRAGNVLLDNSVLTAGTYNSIALFKRHLVAATGSTVSISDLDKPESWPTGLKITVPSGGPITALGVVGYNSPTTGTTDEYLVIFKERETWVITGTVVLDTDTSLYDVELKFVDHCGCPTQSLIAPCNGFITWVDYRGVYMWNGTGKPVYISRPIEGLFGPDGDLDKSKLTRGFGVYFRKKNQVIWALSHRTVGEQKLFLKLDLRLTTPKVSEGISGNTVAEGVFIQDLFQSAYYAGVSFLPTNNDELLLLGDDAGFLYSGYASASDNGVGVEFSYTTKAFDLGIPGEDKQFHKVLVYIDQTAAKDLTLQYWSGYRSLSAERAEISITMDTADRLTASLWDLAVWDVSLWDEFSPKQIPLLFNLNSSQGSETDAPNNARGDSIMLKFVQNDASTPVTIYGFSIYWDEIGLTKQ